MFHGSIVAIVTPMKASGEVDYGSMRDLLDWHINNKTSAVVILGTTGESATVTGQDRIELIKSSIHHISNRIPVIVGTGTNSTESTIELTRQAMDLGADATLLVTPYYNKPTQEGLYQHYKTVAQAVAIPQILYNVPSRTGCDLLPETIKKLADVPNIIGVKEATGDVERLKQIKQLCGKTLDLFSGDDLTGLEFLLAGGKGVISVTANIAPDKMSELCDACVRGDIETAQAINEQLMPLHQKLFVESNPIPAKWALHLMGKIPEGIRMPLTTLAKEQHTTVRDALQQSGVLS